MTEMLERGKGTMLEEREGDRNVGEREGDRNVEGEGR